MVLGTSLPGLLLVMGFCHGEVYELLQPAKHNGQGRGKSTSGRPPPLNPSELFTGQFLPTKPAIPDSQQPKLPLKEIGREAECCSRKHRGGENQAARQSDPPVEG